MNVSKKRALTVILTVIFGCVAMSVVDGVLSPSYPVKSLIKLLVFGVLPFAVSSVSGIGLRDVLRPQKKGLLIFLGVGVAIYAFILTAYFLLRDVFDFSAVTASLTSDEGVTRDNFIYVAAYISFCNSFLEEFFFRGFAFLALRNYVPRSVAYAFSALSFGVYHVAIMSGWFGPLLFGLLMLGLFAGGVIFNFVDEKTGDVFPSYIVHAFSNLATNTVGLILFGIL